MDIVDAQALSKREFEGLALAYPYLELFGFMEWAFQALIWGDKGSGKSTLAMGLARALVDFAELPKEFTRFSKNDDEKVLFVSSEEGPGLTVSSRAARMGAQDDALLISNFSSIDALKMAVLRHDVRFLIIDSVTVVDPSTKAARSFMQWCRDEEIGVALIAQAMKGGNDFKGDNRLGHNVDVVVHCWQDDDGVHRARATKNRFKPQVEIEIPMTGERFARPNPDCTAPQSAQCKAIFASLDEGGRSGSSKSKKKKKKKSTSAPKKAAHSAAARSFDSTLSNLTGQLSDALA